MQKCTWLAAPSRTAQLSGWPTVRQGTGPSTRAKFSTFHIGRALQWSICPVYAHVSGEMCGPALVNALNRARPHPKSSVLYTPADGGRGQRFLTAGADSGS